MKKRMILMMALLVAGSAQAGWKDVMEYQGATVSIGDKKQVRIGNTVIFWERIKLRSEFVPWDTGILRIAADCETFENATIGSSTYRNNAEITRDDEPSSVSAAEPGSALEAAIDAACMDGEVKPSEINTYAPRRGI